MDTIIFLLIILVFQISFIMKIVIEIKKVVIKICDADVLTSEQITEKVQPVVDALKAIKG